jgi:hypothetical protein
MEKVREACIHFSRDGLQTCDAISTSNIRQKVESGCVKDCPHYEEGPGAEELKAVKMLNAK